MELENKKPIIHCITNIITVNDCANVLHAIGAAPVMAHHPKEVEEVTMSASALVINLGATEDFEAMQIAIKAADQVNIPIVIDPVGAGGITFRRTMFRKLLAIASPSCIRGNMSEIKALYFDFNTTIGVDAISSNREENDAEIVRLFARKMGCIVVASGQTDIISDGEKCIFIESGTKMLTHITGAGCMSSAMIGGYLGKSSASDDRMEIIRQACQCMAESGVRRDYDFSYISAR